MKNSRFNLFIKYGKGYIVFNTFSRALIWVDGELARTLQRGNVHDIPPEQLEALRIHGFVVDAKVDELQISKAIYWAAKFSPSGLGVTILPTYTCNMACSYCYEGLEKPLLNMNAETAERVCEWLMKMMESTRSSDLSLVFYGGEPLLNLGAIYRICETINEYCAKHSARLWIGLVTNGVLLNNLTAKQLLELNLRWVQVTLDGPPKIHDKRRPLKTGEGTFSLIYNNIKSFVSLARDKAQLVIRINLDKENITQVPLLLEMLIQDGLAEAVTVSIGQIIATCCNMGYANNLLSDKEMVRSYIDLLNDCHLIEAFKSSFVKFEPPPTFCGAQTANSFIIDPLGKMYKCWELINSEDFCLGDLEKGIDQHKHMQWLSFDPFQDKECRKCVYLPICGGGCRSQALFRFGNLYKSICHWSIKSWKTIIRRRVELLYAEKITEF